MPQLLLRPSLRYSLPLVIMVVLGDLCAAALAVGFLAIHNLGAALLMVAAAAMTGGSTLAYFRRASLRIDGHDFIKTDALGRTSRCAVEDVARIESRYAPQPTWRFIRRDGSVAFQVNARLWRTDQMDALRSVLQRCGS